ncbi:MAG: hypothetical protein DLM60_23880 [Pseudonocardiales bacterium]|nr:MAG: hypothetical protein DLM60_23880 [Pseudonocardiales bacterium]
MGDQPGRWEAILPAELQVLPCELARVEALLDDPAFFAVCVVLRSADGSAIDVNGDIRADDVLKFRHRLG